MNLKPTLLLLAALFSFTSALTAQECHLYDDYSRSDLWSQVGTGVSIQNGALTFDNARDKYYQKRMVRSLDVTLNECDTWVAEFEFTPQDLGDWTGIDDAAGHDLLAFTAGTQNPTSDCSCNEDCSQCGYPNTDQDAIICMLLSDANGGNVGFDLVVKDGTTENRSEGNRILLPQQWKNKTFYLRMERRSSQTAKLSVFTDPGRTQALPGSPVTKEFEGSVTGLNTLQHANHARGHWPRNLWGTLDNLCMRWEKMSGQNPFVIYASPDNQHVTVRYADCCGKPVSMHLVDADGKLLDYRINDQDGEEVFETSGLEAGIYYIQVSCEEWMKSGSFVKE